MPERVYRWQFPYLERGPRRSPSLRVRFTYHQTTPEYNGLVDSGAERSACSVAVARQAGLDPLQFPTFQVHGANGVSVARLCPIDISILGRRIETEILVIDTMTVLVLLGRNDVFQAFQFGFDERASALLVEPYA